MFFGKKEWIYIYISENQNKIKTPTKQKQNTSPYKKPQTNKQNHKHLSPKKTQPTPPSLNPPIQLLKFKNLQTNFLTFHLKLHWQWAALGGHSKVSGASMDGEIHLPQKKISGGSIIYATTFTTVTTTSCYKSEENLSQMKEVASVFFQFKSKC